MHQNHMYNYLLQTFEGQDKEKPKGYLSSIDNDGTTDGNADSDGEWTFNTTTKRITHQRRNNSRHYWTYDNGVNVIGGGVEGIDATEDCNNLASSACNEVPPPVEGGA